MNNRKYFKTNSSSKGEVGNNMEQSLREAWFRYDVLQQPTTSTFTLVAPEMPKDLINKRSFPRQPEIQETNERNRIGINIIENKIIKHKPPEVSVPPKNHNFNHLTNFYEPISPPSPESLINGDINEEPVDHEIHILTGPEYKKYLMFKEFYEKSDKDQQVKQNTTANTPETNTSNIRQQQIEEIIGLSNGYKDFLINVMNIITKILQIPKRNKSQGILGQLCQIRRKLTLDILENMASIFLLNEATTEVLEIYMNEDIPEAVYDILIREFSINKDQGLENIDEEIKMAKNMKKNIQKQQATFNPPKATKNTQQTNNERTKDSKAAENQRDWPQFNETFMSLQTSNHAEKHKQQPMEYLINNKQGFHTFMPYPDRNQNMKCNPQQRMQATANTQTMPSDIHNANPSIKPKQIPRTATLPSHINFSTYRDIKFPRAAVVLPNCSMQPEQYHTENFFPVYHNQNQHPMMSTENNYLNIPYL